MFAKILRPELNVVAATWTNVRADMYGVFLILGLITKPKPI